MTMSLHVRHEVKPDRTFAVLQAIASDEPIDYIVQSERQVSHLRQIGLVEQSEVTGLGNELLSICYHNADLWGDLLHYIHYTLWDSEDGKQQAFSWTYRQFTDAAWNLGTFEISTEIRESIVSSLINLAEEEPEIDLSSLSKQSASLSKDSLTAIINWLSSLRPPVIEGKTFQRRYFCPPELMLLAVGHVGKMSDADLGIDLLLTPDRRDAICRLCVLEPAALDKTLNWMLPLYPQIVVPGTTAGTYGRFLRFLRWPTLADVAGR